MPLDSLDSNDFLVAIPVFNEERHVNRVLDDVRRHVRDILVLDDGSTDSTPQLLSGRDDVHVITHPENRGYGKSLADAFTFAGRTGAKWLITMDCDGQHEPTHLEQFMNTARQDLADVISGTRYPRGRAVEASVPPDRLRINRRITALLNQKLGLDITDAFCGYKAYRVEALAHLDITVPGYAMPIQMWVQIAAAGLTVCELPVPLIYNDPNRHFGGLLDDPDVRYDHYLSVLDTELAVRKSRASSAPSACVPCP